MRGKKERFLIQTLPVLVILFVMTVLVTWQITYTSVRKDMNAQYAAMLESLSASNDVSRTVYKADSILRGKYIGEIDENKLADETLAGYVNGLGDKYAYYMDAETYAEYLLENREGVKTGIGVSVVYDNKAGGLYLIGVYENTPAENAGLQPGEVITHVDGQSVVAIGYSLAVERITDGEAGSSLTLTVRAVEGAERTVHLTREEIKLVTVTYRMVSKDTGLIRISEFTSQTPEEFKTAIEKLSVEGAERFVFDVRNNPGGSLDGVSKTLDFLLPEGDIIIINEKDGTRRTLRSDFTQFNAPMAVLVNKNTASAAELFTAALRDYDKAPSVGERTYGKGSMQEIVPMPGGGAASVSVSTYLPPCGISYDGEGIKPDYTVELSEEASANFYRMSDEEDTQLQKALELVAEMEVTSVQ